MARMGMISVVSLEEKNVVPALQEAGEKLDGGSVETVLDFSSVRRLDASSLHAVQAFAFLAEEKQSKLSLRGVNVEIYKTLKLAKLKRTFSFLD
jgi:anti-anti-sigma regulatory factor